MRTLVLDLLCQEKIDPKNAPAFDAGSSHVPFTEGPSFILAVLAAGIVSILAIAAIGVCVAFLAHKLRKPTE